MGLFDKKYCDVCGEKIGLLGNRKLSDGNLCKECAAKLSPWFSERRQSTVEDIKRQLEYREQNKAKAAAFSPTEQYGESMRVFIDMKSYTFAVSRSADFARNNTDIIPITDVVNVGHRVEEDKDEIYNKDANGNNVRFNPPRYKFSYDFYLTFTLRHPFISEIEFKVNDYPAEGINTMKYHETLKLCDQIELTFTRAAALAAASLLDHTIDPGGSPGAGAKPEPMGGGAEAVREAKPETESRPLFCPNCGSRFDPNAPLPRFCPNCGTPTG